MHSARGLRIQLSGHEPATSEIVPTAFLRVETNIVGPQLSEGDFYTGLPAHMRPKDATTHATVLKGELDYLDDLEIKRWRFGVHIVETITKTPHGLNYTYGAHLFGAPQLVGDTDVELPSARERIGLAWQVLKGRRRVVNE
ncbi:hypothetical protein [Pseudonocardia humida]|uniref:Uncharacterized protein n=1 Tax=Pseudonocardia humida TaxID=2800819 RepID=A0ABT1A286_9PSEU|nr:hypothetical protein [Pseudonocardia humida]MCO1657121.1 hypothetical protein [Pseudonocardia humida]